MLTFLRKILGRLKPSREEITFCFHHLSPRLLEPPYRQGDIFPDTVFLFKITHYLPVGSLALVKAERRSMLVSSYKVKSVKFFLAELTETQEKSQLALKAINGRELLGDPASYYRVTGLLLEQLQSELQGLESLIKRAKKFGLLSDFTEPSP